MAIFRREPPLTGASNAGGVGRKRDSRQIADYRSTTAAVRTTTVTVGHAVYHTDCHESVNLVYHSQHGRPRQRDEKQNLIVCSGKSEVEVVNNRRLRSTRSIAQPLSLS